MLARGPALLVVALSLAACAAPAASPKIEPARAVEPAPPRTEVVVRAQTRDEAFAFLWRQLVDMPFYRANGYDVALPAHPLFRRLAAEGARDDLRDEARRVFASEVFDPRAFDAGLVAFADVPSRLGPALAAFEAWSRAWGFERRARVDVVLTLYGPGGTYDPDASTITVLTTSEGKLRKRPLENVVHEMVHLGVERPVVRRFGLTHPEKERLVDRICVVAFRELLPDYKVQPMGPPELDAFVDAAALADLPAAVARYVAARPRTSSP